MQKLELSMDLDPIHCWLGYPVQAEIVVLVPINVKRKNVKCKKKWLTTNVSAFGATSRPHFNL